VPRIQDEIVAEHARVAATLELVGPEAPGGVGTWTAADLAAHLFSEVVAGGVVVFAGRSLVARGVRLNDLARSSTDRVVALYRRKGFGRAIESLRNGPPRLLLRPSVAPVTLFEVWVHHDDVRRANDLEPLSEPETLGQAVDFALRYQRKALGSAPVDRSASNGDLLRWLAGRPSAIPAHPARLHF
jgi:uncharacterized protein (TIGR03083 family)